MCACWSRVSGVPPPQPVSLVSQSALHVYLCYRRTNCCLFSHHVCCAQAIAANLTPQDTLSARLTCSTWASSTPLPQISISLTVTPSGISCEGLAKVQALLLAQQQSKETLDAVRRIVLSLTPASNACACAAACATQQAQAQPSAASSGSQQHQQCATSTAQQQCTALHGVDSDQLLAQVLASLPYLTSAVISVHKPKQPHDIMLQKMVNPNSTCSAASNRGSTIQDCHTVLLQLLALPQLQCQLSSLTLACEGIWPNHQQLATALEGVKHLTTLQLLNCPLSALTRLPSLPQLQQLAVSGRLLEPIPRSYSARSLPLLPQLPGLRLLSIRQLPQDVQRQEELDVYCCLLQQQRAAAAAAAGAGNPDHATGDSSSSSSSSFDTHGQQQQQQVPNAATDLRKVQDWRPVQQWVSSSIQQQCPNLVQLQSDMALGQALTQIQQPKAGSQACSRLQLGCAPTTRCAQIGASAAVHAAARRGDRTGSKAVCAAVGAADSNHSSTARCSGLKGPAAVSAIGHVENSWCCCQQRVLCSCCS